MSCFIPRLRLRVDRKVTRADPRWEKQVACTFLTFVLFLSSISFPYFLLLLADGCEVFFHNAQMESGLIVTSAVGPVVAWRGWHE